MRILVACAKVPGSETGAGIFSGAGRRALRLARQFAGLGHEVILLTTTQDPWPEDGLQVVSMPPELSWVQPPARSRPVKAWHAWRGMRHCRKLLSRYQPDVVLTLSLGLLSMQLILAGHRLGIPVVMGTTLLGSDDLLTLKQSRMGRVRWWLLQRTAAIVNLTPALQHAAATAGYPAERLHLIPNGVDCERFAPLDPAGKRQLRQRLGLDPHAFIVASVGAIIERKGMLGLVEGFIAVAGDLPNASLVLVGPVDDTGNERAYARSIRERMATSSMEPRVRLAGEVTDTSDWLRAADGFAFNSSAEGFPSAVIEAMAADLPLAVRQLPGTTDFIVEGARVARLVRDDGDWPDALRWLASAGAGNAARAQECFSLTRVTAQYVELFSRLQAVGRATQVAALAGHEPDHA